MPFTVTEFKVPGEAKKLYLSAIIDLYDRYPVSYIISARNDNRLVFKTFNRAIESNPCARPIFHSDCGFQYTSRMFRKKLEKQEMKQSMSRVGHCIDNGPTEGFWGIIKSEMYQMYEITDESSLRQAIKDYLHFYRDLLTNSLFRCLCLHVFGNAIRRLVNSVIQTAFTSLFRFNAVADKRHSSIDF